ncbi:hypothetical protein [Natrinema versiforme]|uniref:Uncharacterized protein n=1 Tax=Natrinema versiforme JCM 10478 TaxID=1227496 RepID=L9Y472_9EURY|nr:hypothetical protein [Natrinema versiforme]ELY68865.1 hypothetical protein C489_05848 [Natrinema versiforme JCM 10478]
MTDDAESSAGEEDYKAPGDYEDLDSHDRIFARGDIAHWNIAVQDLRELLRTLEDPNLNDPVERREVEEAIFHEFGEIERTFRDAWDSRTKELDNAGDHPPLTDTDESGDSSQ